MNETLNLTNIRKQLHQIPEVSGNEKLTSEYISLLLEKFENIDLVKQVGGYGILAKIFFTNDGPEVLFRAELDALPIQEVNTFEYQSNHDGVSHKCGHDGHMTILISLIEYFQNLKNQKGTIYFLFQPAEENGEGAKACLEYFKINNITFDYIFALHNIPNYSFGEVFVKSEEITPAVYSVKIKIEGRTAHAAEPENGINPSKSIQKIISFFDKMNIPNQEDLNFLICTPIHINMGEIAYGISAGYGEVHYTLRSWKNKVLNNSKQRIEEYITKLSKEEEIKITIEYLEEFRANQNNLECVNLIEEACYKEKIKFNKLVKPFKWGEDFGILTENYKGALFGIGAGENIPTLHNPDYDYPDELTPIGRNLFYYIWLSIQEKYK